MDMMDALPILMLISSLVIVLFGVFRRSIIYPIVGLLFCFVFLTYSPADYLFALPFIAINLIRLILVSFNED
jgi:hypothetical protein